MNKKTITITSIEMKVGETNGNKWQMYRIQDENEDKYSFFGTKKDGNKTKALEGYETLNLKVGSKVGIAFSEEQKKFTNTEGKEIDFTQKTIAFFADLNQSPNPTPEPMNTDTVSSFEQSNPEKSDVNHTDINQSEYPSF